MTGSENHDLNAKVCSLVTSRIFMNEPAYRDRIYPDAAKGPGHGYWFHTIHTDGSGYGPDSRAPWKAGPGANAVAHYDAWVTFFNGYVSERASNGFFLENASSTYQRWTLGFLHTLHRYSGNEGLKNRLGRFFDFVWADWAQEQISGIRGGPKTRHHHTVGGEDAMTDLSRFLLGGPGSTNLLYSAQLLDDYALPEAVVHLALDSLGRGRYEIVTRGIGEEVSDRPRPEGMEKTLMIRPVSRFLKYSWVTPSYILGTQMDHPDAVHSHLSAAGRWHGMIVAGRPDLRIVPTGGLEQGGRRNAHNLEVMYLTAQHRNVFIGQQARRWNQINPAWYPAKPNISDTIVLYVGKGWDEAVEIDGWLFLKNSNTYAAVREIVPARTKESFGALNLRADMNMEGNINLVQIAKEPVVWNEARNGLALRDNFGVFVIHAGSRAEHGSFEEFKKTVFDSKMELHKTVVPGFYTFRYLGTEPGAKEIEFSANSPEIPKIGGEYVNYLPTALTSSPFVNSEFGSGRIRVRKNEYELNLDITR
jgi:hypothetical protein